MNLPFHVRQERSARARAVITGAGSGIGRAFAAELAARGSSVVCADIRLEDAEQTAADIRSVGGQAHAVACDVSVLAEVTDLADRADELLGGPVDLVVNNAGVGSGGRPIGEVDIDDWTWTLGVNLWGVIHGCQVFTPRLRALDRGGIINTASAASFAAAPAMAPYNVSKAGALALSETLAAELGGSGVAVTALCPTFVQTGIVDNGRITASSTRLAQALLTWTGVSPATVAKAALDANDRGRLYALPQRDSQLIWALKRHAPGPYTAALALLNRTGLFGAAAVADQPDPSAPAVPSSPSVQRPRSVSL